MITRKKYVPGYYANLLKQSYYIENDEQDINERKKTKNKTDININKLIKSINFNVIKNLKSERKRAPTIHFKISIENKVYNFLKENFSLNAQYKECNEFLTKYNIEHQRCKNERYYSIASDFEFKLNKGKTLKFNQLKNGKVISREISPNPTLGISFFIKNFP